MTTDLIAVLAIGLLFGLAGGILLSNSRPNIWTTQRKLMYASGQNLPNFAQLNSGNLLYLALIAEELAEGMKTVVEILDDRFRGLAYPGEWAKAPRGLHDVRMKLASMGVALIADSHSLRFFIERVPSDTRFWLNRRESIALADDGADMAVVVAGFTNASGLPGLECYNEVQRSNLSKRDPKTGMIHKDASGKWLKGEKFVRPELGVVLDGIGTVLHEAYDPAPLVTG